MGSGKTEWAKKYACENYEKNILYITPLLHMVDNFRDALKDRGIDIKMPENKGNGKLGNIAKLLESSQNIASTHALFKRFDENCVQALQRNKYTLILDETVDVVEPYQFQAKDDYKYLIANGDITVDDKGLINWTGSDLDTRFDDVRILSKNKCLFKVDDKFFLWHFPHIIFDLFDEVYVLTYLFNGSIMKNYFDLYNIKYEKKTLNDNHELVDYYVQSKWRYRDRISVYRGSLNDNLKLKSTGLSSTYCKSPYNKPTLQKLKNNMYNYCQHVMHVPSDKVMWTAYKSCAKMLSGKGYSKGFVECNCRGLNDYDEKTCLMYCINFYAHPEIEKFFAINGIKIDEDALALSTMIQWIWRSNLRKTDSEQTVSIYIPSARMRQLLFDWLYN